jgi:c-di-GMP-binding flagellar brake protein YcgR
MESDNRKFTRRDIDLVVQIEMADGTTVRGALLDLSQGGVRLKVSNPDNLPERFMLALRRRNWSGIPARATSTS